MKKFLSFSIQKKLILAFVIVLLVPSIAIGGFSYTSAKNKVEEQMLNAASQNVELINQNVNLYFEDRMRLVTYLANFIEGKNAEQAYPIFQDMLKEYPEVQSFYIGTTNGTIINSSTNSGGISSSQEWYKQANNDPSKVYISEPFTKEDSQAAFITLSKKLTDGSGVVAFEMKIDQLKEMINKAKIGNEGYPQVLDQNSKFLIHPNQPVGAPANNAEHKYMFEHESGTTEYMLENEEKKLMFTTNETTGWKISGTMYSNEIAEEARPILVNTVTVIGISIIGAAFLVFIILSSILRPLKRLIAATEKINAGNLNEQIQVRSQDELGQLSNSFNEMVSSLRSMVQQVNLSAVTLTASSEELTASAEESNHSAKEIAQKTQQMAVGSDEQLNSINGAATAITQMSAGIQQIAAHSEEVSTLTTSTLELSTNGANSVQNVIHQMNDIHNTVQDTATIIASLGNRSKEIVNIVSMITEISSQTNLLALNAAIEAARAGEHGKGFAVVADEVRKLAEQSTTSAQQISDLIMSIQKETEQAVASMQSGTSKVESGVETTHKFGELFKIINERVTEVSERVQEVAASINQMSVGSEQIVDSIEIVKELAEEGSKVSRGNSKISENQLQTIEEVTAAAQSLARLAEDMQHTLSKFTL